MSIRTFKSGLSGPLQVVQVLGHEGEHVASFYGAHAEALAHVLVSVIQLGDECASEQANKDWDNAQERHT